MSRTIKEIYNQAVSERNKRLELSEFNSDSKLSVMNGITWAFATVMHSFESLLDVFAMDISTAINSRVNGTPAYYANALLKYQKGDELIVREDGLAFGYPYVDETKRIISQVSYEESSDDINLDNKLILKVATGENGNLSEINKEELVLINSYINKIKFAGTRIEVTSQKGDILIPRVTVYYDGSVVESEMYSLIESALNDYIMSVDFDANVYAIKVIDAIQKVEHVTDVYIDDSATPEQGIFLASYNTDDILQSPVKVKRVAKTVSGYIKQSTGSGAELNIPTFKQAIKLKVGK